MQLELNRRTFRQLIWLQAGLLVAVVPIAIYEVENERWDAFETDFNAISNDHFGRSAELTNIEGVGAAALLVCTVLSLFGMYRFRRWGRLAFLLSFLGAAGLIFVGPTVHYTSWLVDLLEMVSSMTGGVLLLLAYGHGVGEEWFNGKSPNSIEE